MYGRDPVHSKNVWVATGDSDQLLLGGTIGGMVIGGEIAGWSSSKLYGDLYNPR